MVKWLYFILYISVSGVFSWFDHSRIAHNYRMIRHIKVYVRAGSDQNIVSDQDFANNNSIYPYPYRVAENWHALFGATASLTNSNAGGEVAISADNSLMVDYNCSEVADIKTFPDRCVIWYLYRKSITAPPEQEPSNDSK